MLQPAQNQSHKIPSTPVNYTPVKTVTSPMEQATIGRSVTIKGEVSGSEPLFIDGRVEGTIHLPDNRVTIGRNGSVTANIDAKEVVIMGAVKGDILCTDRLDIRGEGSLIGDVVAERISVEDGAMLKGSVEVRAKGEKNEKQQVQAQPKPQEPVKPAVEPPKAVAAAAGASTTATRVPGSSVLFREN